jgi:hypothetical protein
MRMRASSFSNPQVVSTISEYFVPVWTSNDDYGGEKKPAAESEDILNVRRQAASKGLVAGNVNVYILNPEGGVVETMGVSKAMEAQNLLPFLKKLVEEKQLKPRDSKSVAAARAGSKPVDAKVAGSLLVNVATRYLPPGEVEQGVTEDWLTLSPEELKGFMPPADAAVGHTWEIPKEVVEKLFRYGYPPVCNYDQKASKLSKANLKATILAKESKVTLIGLMGQLDMDHSRDGNIDGRVTAWLSGVARYDPAAKAVSSMQIASEKAEYIWHWDKRASNNRFAIIMEGTPAPN